MLTPAEPGLTDDAFLGGRLAIWQPIRGYRAAADPVLLAAAVPARPGQTALDLGCGVGVAALCLGCRVPGLVLAGLERQAEYARLARRNAARNGIALDVVEGDVAAMPAALTGRMFDHVLANPPYFPPGAGTAAADPGREAGRREAEVPLAVWIDQGLRRLMPGGWLTLILAAERLPGILAAIGPRAGNIGVLPLAPREGRPAGRVIVKARKGGRGRFTLAAPLVLHRAGADAAGDSHGAAVNAVLREGAALDF